MSIEISRRKFLSSITTLAAAGTAAVVISEFNGQQLFKSGKQNPKVEIVPNTNTPTPTHTPVYTDIGGEPTAIPTPEKPILSKEMLNLQETLKSEIDAYHGQTAIAITDVKTNETIEVNGNRPQLPGCVANLACALTVVSELSKNKALFTKENIEEDLTIMVRHSNPSVGLRVVEAIGGGSIKEGVNKINQSMKEWGMYKSFYDHPPAYDTTYSANDNSNQMAATEINSVLTKVANSQLFDKKDFDWNVYALWVMSKNKPGLNFMLPGQIPENDAEVFHKVGWVPGQPNTINDAGVVSALDHRFLYTITFMYQNYETAVEEDALFYGPGLFGSNLSKITYDMFSQKYPLPQ